ncbi:unnamed protein product [Dibothriocephalus latus]|uniref:Uncharacterized protein n=1 Tax=Dibothriocephalus latus TaxID=60516 RepID=A0A3P7NLZ8_DIBLA|nr:unnamed protein product [Dibothriocephalus latus]
MTTLNNIPVTSLLQKLSEVKERRIMNAEIEKLRWRLKEAEERQSVFQQIRLERRVAEKLRLQQQESTTLLPNGLIQAAADTTGSNNHGAFLLPAF